MVGYRKMVLPTSEPPEGTAQHVKLVTVERETMHTAWWGQAKAALCVLRKQLGLRVHLRTARLTQCTAYAALSCANGDTDVRLRWQSQRARLEGHAMLTVMFIIWLIQAVIFGGLMTAIVIEFMRRREWWGAVFAFMVLVGFFKLDKIMFDYAELSTLFT